MWSSRLVVVLLAALSLSTQAQVSSLKADNNPATQAAVQKLELDIARLLVQGNWEQYGAQLSEDFVRTAANGEVENKQQAWPEFRSGKNKLLDMILEELQVVTYGDTAVVTSHVTRLERQNGRVITAFSRFTDVFVQRDGRWLMVCSHATPVSK
jgi:polyhydroxyalkanoate synthesis regulator phasin